MVIEEDEDQQHDDPKEVGSICERSRCFRLAVVIEKKKNNKRVTLRRMAAFIRRAGVSV